MPTKAPSNAVVNMSWTVLEEGKVFRVAGGPLPSPALRRLYEKKVILVSNSLV